METTTRTLSPQFDPDLIARYDISGPRYTSYPAAPQFHTRFGEADLRAIARASNEDPIPRPLSLYVHVPFCMSPCFYCGCTRLITRDHSKSVVYLDHLYREIELTAPLFDRDRPVGQLHFGGGTPNFLDARQMGELLESLARHFAFSRDADREFGIELDPRYCEPDYVRMLATHGFNRVSVGIQDFDPEVQRAVNRIQSIEQTRAVLDAARESGFRSTSVDLIYGLPKQTAGWIRAHARSGHCAGAGSHRDLRLRAPAGTLQGTAPDRCGGSSRCSDASGAARSHRGNFDCCGLPLHRHGSFRAT